jgi:hypothetical protein
MRHRPIRQLSRLHLGQTIKFGAKKPSLMHRNAPAAPSHACALNRISKAPRDLRARGFEGGQIDAGIGDDGDFLIHVPSPSTGVVHYGKAQLG